MLQHWPIRDRLVRVAHNITILLFELVGFGEHNNSVSLMQAKVQVVMRVRLILETNSDWLGNGNVLIVVGKLATANFSIVVCSRHEH